MYYFQHQGKQYNKVVKTHAEGKAWEVEKKKELKQATATPPSLMFSHATKLYLEDCQARMQHNTFREKRTHLREFAKYLRKDVRMEDVTVILGKQFLLTIQKECGNKAANRRLRTFKALWNWHREAVPYNPWRGIPIFAEDKATRYVPPKEDAAKVLALAQPWELELLTIYVHTGARLSELLNLKWSDIDLGNKTMLLWTRKRKHGSLESRTLPIDASVYGILKELQNHPGNGTHVFVNPRTGTRYGRNQPCIAKMLGRLCSQAEVKPFGFHSLRHYFSARLAESRKAGLTDLQLLLGHQKATTTDIYLRSLTPQIGHLADIINEAVAPANTNPGTTSIQADKEAAHGNHTD